jgi:adenosylcobinamide kinase/adenosylcobinamide-phosphate guanylyltransferase
MKADRAPGLLLPTVDRTVCGTWPGQFSDRPRDVWTVRRSPEIIGFKTSEWKWVSVGEITIVTGGHRAGKSDVAEHLVGSGPATYLATLVAQDENMRARVARHQRLRPATWSLIEEPHDVPRVLSQVSGTVLFDSLSQWVKNDVKRVNTRELIQALLTRNGDTVIVTAEVGSGAPGRDRDEQRYFDRLGEVNQAVSKIAQRALLVVMARVIELPFWEPGGREVVELEPELWT